MDDAAIRAALAAIDVVMVETTHAGNLGAAARAMKNMGLSQLVLVNPQASIDDEAIARASRADDILHQARIVPSLTEALANASLVVGTSARSRHIPWPLLSPRELGARVASALPAGNRIALVFGRESNGLSNDELQLCHLHVHIPTDADYSSLNVAQAIQLLCYEMRLAVSGEELTSHQAWGVEWDYPLATHEQLDGMLRHLEQTLVDIDFLDPNTPKQLMTRLRRLYQRAAPDQMEINMLRGMLAQINKRLPPRSE
ncbi:RNA methyltransferase [Bacterioplanes sanyensis]